MLNNDNKELVFATNGGIFSKEFSPLGLYIENNKIISELNVESGEGNFFMKPNGVFVIENNKAKIVETSKYIYSKDISNAIQSGPLLVINDKINSAFNKNSQSKYIRSGVGVRKNGEIIFSISNKPVTFYDFALLFKEELDCENALYLDGAISEMYIAGEREYVGKEFSVMISITKEVLKID